MFLRRLSLLVVVVGLMAFMVSSPVHAKSKGVKAATSAATKVSNPLNLNTATAKELQVLPGIGPKIAERIVKYREKNGPFSSVDDLTKVKGIGQKKLEKIRPFLKVGKISSTKVPKGKK